MNLERRRHERQRVELRKDHGACLNRVQLMLLYDGYVQKLLGLTSAAKVDDAFPNAVKYPVPATPTFTIPA